MKIVVSTAYHIIWANNYQRLLSLFQMKTAPPPAPSYRGWKRIRFWSWWTSASRSESSTAHASDLSKLLHPLNNKPFSVFLLFQSTASVWQSFSWPRGFLLITKEMNGCFSVNLTPLWNGPCSPLIGLNSPRGLNWSESHLDNFMLLHTYLGLHKAKQNAVRQWLIGF